MTDFGSKSTAGKTDAEASPGPATRQIFVFRRLIVFLHEFAAGVPHWRLVSCGLLILLGGLTEGISLVLLVPLVEIVSETSASPGWITAGLSQGLAAIGLPPSLLGLL